MVRSEQDYRHVVSADILDIFRASDEIGWKNIRETSVQRILYLATVLFSFNFPEKENIFSNYTFSLEKYVGPFNSSIRP